MPESVANEKGFALIVTLLITAILVAVIAEVVYSVHIQASTIGSYRDGQRAAILAEGGVELASLSVSDAMKGKDYTAYKDEDAAKSIRVSDGVLSMRVEDEGGKFQVNSIVFPNGETNQENYSAFSRLLKGVGLREELPDAAADWIDINDEPRPRGAETYDYYKGLGYSAKNSPLDSTEELLLVKGYKPDILRNLSPFITVYTDGRVNINTAPKEVIKALSDGITSEMAQRVIDYRNASPFKDTAEIRKVPGFETVGFALQGRITVKSGIFRIFSRALVGEGVREVESVVDVQSSPRKILYWRER